MPAPLAMLLTLMLAVPTLAQAASCREEIGASRARILVERCMGVSPATHPPCNESNDCALIRAEIARSCLLLPRADRPGWCAQYQGR